MTGDFSWVLGLFSNVWGLAFVVLLLGGSIFVHELGHFLAARWRGMKVDRFSIGFGPKIFSWKGKDGVEYRVSWLPFGGYVALPQLADVRALEGEPSADLRDLPQPSYLDKVIVVTAGVVFNMILALVISLLLWPLGVPMPASTDTQVVGYVYKTMTELREGAPLRELPSQNSPRAPKLDNTPAPAYAAGLRPGDRILTVDGEPVRNFRDLPSAVALGSGRDAQGHPSVTITYEREGKQLSAVVLPALVSTNSRSGDDIREIGLRPAQHLLVDDVEDNSPALRAGLRHGDTITSVNGEKVYSLDQMNDFIDATNGQPLKVSVLRDGKTVDLSLKPFPIPCTTPLATLFAGNVSATTPPATRPGRLDLLPIYPKNSIADPASPASPAVNLLVWNLDNLGQIYGGMRPGDFLLSVNKHKVSSVQEAVDEVKATPAGQPLALGYLSHSEQSEQMVNVPTSVSIVAEVTPPESIARIGAMFKMESKNEYSTPLRQFSDAFGQIFGMLRSLFNPHSDIGIQHLTGPIGISRIIYQFSLVDIRMALWFAFIINVNLAVLNLLPIPVLDGGHLVFFTISRLRRRDLPLNFVSSAQGVCLVLLLSLIVFVIFNDSRRWLGSHEDEQDALRDRYYYLTSDQIMKFPASPTPAAVPPTPVVPVTTN